MEEECDSLSLDEHSDIRGDAVPNGVEYVGIDCIATSTPTSKPLSSIPMYRVPPSEFSKAMTSLQQASFH